MVGQIREGWIHDCLLDTIIHMQLAAQGSMDYRFLIGYGRRKKKKKEKENCAALLCSLLTDLLLTSSETRHMLKQAIHLSLSMCSLVTGF